MQEVLVGHEPEWEKHLYASNQYHTVIYVLKRIEPWVPQNASDGHLSHSTASSIFRYRQSDGYFLVFYLDSASILNLRMLADIACLYQCTKITQRGQRLPNIVTFPIIRLPVGRGASGCQKHRLDRVECLINNS